MNKKFPLFGLWFFWILGSLLFASHRDTQSVTAQSGGKTLVLYDAASGAVPSARLLNFAAFPPDSAQPVYSSGATILDTTVPGTEAYAGWTSYGSTTPGFPALDPAAGFQVEFTLQVEQESHLTDNRSGFSLIVLTQDARGIELAFWEAEVWAQSDNSTGGLFTRGEGASFPTTAGLVDYRLAVTRDSYSLSANGEPILNGPLRDYSAFEGFPDPYQTPNFLFLGDDTAAAQARVRLRFVAVTGSEVVTPTVTGTAVPQATASPLPTSTATPVASPVPPKRADELCPAGGFFLVLMVTIPRMLGGSRKMGVRGGSRPHSHPFFGSF